MSKPTLVLVHGSWHSPKHFEPIAADLESHGFKCVLVALPSTQSPELPPATLTDDTNAVRAAVVAELDAGRNVVVVAHSYGGVPANNALKDLDSNSRGDKACVKSIIFISAAALPTGTTFLQAIGGAPGPIHDLRTPDFSWVGDKGPEYFFYNTMEPDEAKKWAALLRPQSWAAYEEKTTYAAYKDFESFYLMCKRDQAMTWAMQEGVIKGVEADGGKLRIGEVDSDHSPFLSRLGETSGYIRQVAMGEML